MQLGRRGSEARGCFPLPPEPGGHCRTPEQTSPPRACLGPREVVANSPSTMAPSDSLLDVTLPATPTSRTDEALKDE